MNISNYQRQHEELKELANELAGTLDPDFLKTNASAVHSVLYKLAGKLNLHLSFEDNNLYPTLAASGNVEAQNTAKSFQDEMGGLSNAFKGYLANWANSMTIQNNPGQFIEQTKGIYEALSSRIEREESILYPLAAAVG